MKLKLAVTSLLATLALTACNDTPPRETASADAFCDAVEESFDYDFVLTNRMLEIFEDAATGDLTSEEFFEEQRPVIEAAYARKDFNDLIDAVIAASDNEEFTSQMELMRDLNGIIVPASTTAVQESATLTEFSLRLNAAAIEAIAEFPEAEVAGIEASEFTIERCDVPLTVGTGIQLGWFDE